MRDPRPCAAAGGWRCAVALVASVAVSVILIRACVVML